MIRDLELYAPVEDAMEGMKDMGFARRILMGSACLIYIVIATVLLLLSLPFIWLYSKIV
jgi:hypothetical protein